MSPPGNQSASWQGVGVLTAWRDRTIKVSVGMVPCERWSPGTQATPRGLAVAQSIGRDHGPRRASAASPHRRGAPMDALTVETSAASLQEPQVPLLRQVLRTLGPDRCAAILMETLTCEANGGMLTKDGTRRRTPGGVFFQLVKERATRQACHRLFDSPTPRQPKTPARAQ